jgi:hypothetical protein
MHFKSSNGIWGDLDLLSRSHCSNHCRCDTFVTLLQPAWPRRCNTFATLLQPTWPRRCDTFATLLQPAWPRRCDTFVTLLQPAWPRRCNTFVTLLQPAWPRRCDTFATLQFIFSTRHLGRCRFPLADPTAPATASRNDWPPQRSRTTFQPKVRTDGTCSGNIQGTFRDRSGTIQGPFRDHSGTIQGELSGRPWASIPNARST